LDRVLAGGDAELPVAVERDRPEVALRQAFYPDQLEARLAQLLDAERELHVEQSCGVVQALQVIVQPEAGGALRGLVAADAFEHTRSVVQAVDADVDLGVGPVDELAVHPDLLGLLHRRASFGLPAWTDSPNRTRGPRQRPSGGPASGAGARPERASPCGSPSRLRPKRPRGREGSGRGGRRSPPGAETGPRRLERSRL